MKKFNLNDNLIQTTEVFAAKGIHKAVDPKKTFRKRKENKEAYLILVDFWVQMNNV